MAKVVYLQGRIKFSVAVAVFRLLLHPVFAGKNDEAIFQLNKSRTIGTSRSRLLGIGVVGEDLKMKKNFVGLYKTL